MSPEPVNLPASVRQRLLNLARAHGEDFQRILVQYALERLLYRIGSSDYSDQFILKGALLFTLWMEEPHRRTKDLDLLGKGAPSPERLIAVFRDLCDLTVIEDGLEFGRDSVAATPIREDNIYGGIRVTLKAYLDKARIPLQIDIGFGDDVVPGPRTITFPTLLEFPSPNLRAYEPETVIAEKLSAMVSLDIDNSRMKDFYDLWTLSRIFPFDGVLLSNAISATFARRGLPVPTTCPTGLSPAFASNARKQGQWQAFIRQSVTNGETAPSLADVVTALAAFLLPVLHAAATKSEGIGSWPPGGPWLSQ